MVGTTKQLRFMLFLTAMLLCHHGKSYYTTDVYVENRLSESSNFEDIFIKTPTVNLVANAAASTHKLVTSLPLSPQALDRNRQPDYRFSMMLNRQEVFVDCYTSNINNNPSAGVRIGSTYTERSSWVAGVSNEIVWINANGKSYKITLQVYPYGWLGTKCDINVIVQRG